MTRTPDRSCRWCKGTGYLCEDDLKKTWEESISASAGVNCPRCNPYGTAAPISDADMDMLVSGQQKRA